MADKHQVGLFGCSLLCVQALAMASHYHQMPPKVCTQWFFTLAFNLLSLHIVSPTPTPTLRGCSAGLHSAVLEAALWCGPAGCRV